MTLVKKVMYSCITYNRVFLIFLKEKITYFLCVHNIPTVSSILNCDGFTFLIVERSRVGHAPLLGYDLLDGGIGRLHTKFQTSAALSKKVMIFFPKKLTLLRKA